MCAERKWRLASPFRAPSALFGKVDGRRVNVPVDYAACRISVDYLIGYGPGYQQQYCDSRFPARITHRVKRGAAHCRSASKASSGSDPRPDRWKGLRRTVRELGSKKYYILGSDGSHRAAH